MLLRYITAFLYYCKVSGFADSNSNFGMNPLKLLWRNLDILYFAINLLHFVLWRCIDYLYIATKKLKR